MTEFGCERCFVVFTEKKGLIKHLKRKNICIPIGTDIDPEQLILELTKKEGIECKNCTRIYKNKESLRSHVCKAKNKETDEEKLSNKELVELVHSMKNMIQDLLKNPPNVVNNTTNHTTNNIDNSTNINISLNCLLDTSGKPIEYLLNQENIAEKIIGWLKLNQKVIPAYITEKYYNLEHPENQMIRAGKNKESMELHIGGKWKEYENMSGSDMVLTNIGNDFGVFLEIIKEHPDLYTQKKKIIKQFEKDIIKPLSWGLESSEESIIQDKQIIKNDIGEFVYEEEEEERIKHLQLQSMTIDKIHKSLIDQ